MDRFSLDISIGKRIRQQLVKGVHNIKSSSGKGFHISFCNLEMQWRCFPFHTDIPPEGRRLADLFAGRPADMEAAMQNLAKAAEKAGLPFQPYDRVYNSRPPQELETWAASQNCGKAFHKAVFTAYFAEKKKYFRSEGACGSGISPVPVPERRNERLDRKNFPFRCGFGLGPCTETGNPDSADICHGGVPPGGGTII